MFLVAVPLLLVPHYAITRDEFGESVVSDVNGYAYVLSTGTTASGFISRFDPDGKLVYRVGPFASYPPMQMTTDSGGNLYTVAGTSVVKFDPAGNAAYRFTLPAAAAGAPAIGPDGSAYFTGSAGTGGFPTTPGAWVPAAAAGFANAFAVKLSPAGDRIVYSTFLDNGKPNFLVPTAGLAIAVDAQGSAYVAGTTQNPNFSVTPGAYKVECGCATLPAVFLAKLTPDGTGVSYSALIEPGTSQAMYAEVLPAAIQVDAAGNALVLSGPQIFEPTYVELRRLTTDGAGLSTTKVGVPGADVFQATLDPQGNILMAGAITGDFRPTEGGFRASDSGTVLSVTKSSSAVITLSHPPSLAARLPWSISISGAGGNGWSAVNGTFVCAPAGVDACSIPADTSDFGDLTQVLRYSIRGKANFFAVARPDDGALLYSSALPFGGGARNTVSISGDAGTGIVVLRQEDQPNPQLSSLTRFVADTTERPRILGISDNAASNLSSNIAPGEALTIFGVNLGPPGGVNAAFGDDGRLPLELAGTTVDFNGTPGPLLSVSDQQVTVMAPFELQAGDVTDIHVNVDGDVSNGAAVMAASTAPHFFLFPGYPEALLALNQDGTINSGSDVAACGSVITVFVNGAGLLSPLPPDGSQGQEGQTPVLPTSVAYNVETDFRYGTPPRPLELLYAGSSPGLVAGVLQINFRLPPSAEFGGIFLNVKVGDQGIMGFVACTNP